MGTSQFILALVAAVLSVGGAQFVDRLFKGWTSLRSGAQTRERDAVADLVRARDDAEDRCRVETTDKMYWQGTAGGYYFQLKRGGIEPDPADPVPPSERD